MAAKKGQGWSSEKDLSMPGLVAESEWVAVAALATTSGNLSLYASAVQLLVDHVGDKDAFHLLWHLAMQAGPTLGSQDMAFEAMSRIAGSPAMSGDVRSEVRAFILEAPTGSQHRANARAALLAGLDGRSGPSVARQVIETAQTGSIAMPEAVIKAAVVWLTQSSKPADSHLAMDVIATWPPTERLDPLLELEDDPQRQAYLAGALEALLSPSYSVDPAHLSRAWFELTGENKSCILSKVMPAVGGDLSRLFTRDAAGTVGGIEFARLLTPSADMPPTISASLAVSIAALLDPLEVAALCGALSDTVEPSTLSNLRGHVRVVLEQTMDDDAARNALGAALLKGTLRQAGLDDMPNDPAMFCLDSLLLVDAVRGVPKPLLSAQADQLGWFLAWFPSRGKPGRTDLDDRGEAVAHVLASLSKTTRRKVAAALLATSQPIPPSVFGTLVAERDTRALLPSREEEFVAWAGGEPAGENLAEAALLVLGTTDSETVARGCTGVIRRGWGQLGLDPAAEAESFIEAAKGYDDLIIDTAVEDLRSLLGVEAGYAPEPRLALLLDSAIELGLADHGAVSGPELLRPLTTRPELRSRLVRLLAEADASADFVELAAEAAENFHGKTDPYGPARKAQATKLVAVATDASADVDKRVTSLQLAVRADEAIGRSAALDLARATTLHVRRAAADVLATTQGNVSEAGTIESCLADEEDRLAAESFERALSRIESGDVGTAFRHLVEYTGADVDVDQVDTDVVLPAPWRDNFIQQVDEVRANQRATSQSRIIAIMRLGEILTELAIGTKWTRSGDARLVEKGDALLRNLPTKIAYGTLIHNQQLNQEERWLSAAAVLHTMRGVHAADRGTTSPRISDEDDVIAARVQLRIIVKEWVRIMYS